jgi:hypothetical protein
MKTIFIDYQTGTGQYDTEGRQITEWSDKYCAWIVLPEYEEAYNNGEIDWWGEDNDFPAGETLTELKKEYPNADEWPTIIVTWYWEPEGYLKQFKVNPSSKEVLTYSNSWGYLNYTKEQAIKLCGTYCRFNKYATRVNIKYNNEIIFDGKLD